ncbi:hypothetical protein TrVFT333_007744 [Trichoderma virens FT-333]|nr:hypothetical protein TrVFT333_007744 [Trichoderma virens FT-333]
MWKLAITKSITQQIGAIRCRTQHYKRLSKLQGFHTTHFRPAVVPYLLADIGEGITECQIMSWAVKPGDHVNQFDAICEVQSDKASVEITSRYEGIIKQLHYNVDDLAAVGSPLVDIEIEDEISPLKADEEALGTLQGTENVSTDGAVEKLVDTIKVSAPTTANTHFATPAVRRLLKESNIEISQVQGTGKDGRVLKEDVHRHIMQLSNQPEQQSDPKLGDETVALSPVQTKMFQSMTGSLSIPHFLYTHRVNFSPLTLLRKRAVDQKMLGSLETTHPEKLTALPIILKAVSEALKRYPIMNSNLAIENISSRPSLVLKSAHNIGVGMDTPSGLLVPVVRNVQNHSVLSLSKELARLSTLAKEGKLSPKDMSGATIVVSNIGSIGGEVVAPVILPPAVAILGIGRSRQVPVFQTNKDGTETITKQEEAILSWSADHRILDGATVARCAQMVGSLLENPELMSLICH